MPFILIDRTRYPSAYRSFTNCFIQLRLRIQWERDDVGNSYLILPSQIEGSRLDWKNCHFIRKKLKNTATALKDIILVARKEEGG